MNYIHIRSLEKYHPGYKDRTLQWGKIHFKMVQGDPDCELISNEVDWGRLIKMILLELEAQRPLPNIDGYWLKKGFDIKKRPMSLTIDMLHNFLEEIQDLTQDVHVDKSKNKTREDSVTVTDFFNYFNLKTKKNFKLTPANKELITKRLNDGFTLDQLKLAVDNFILDDWPDRHKHLDLVYCIGVRNKIDNLDKWLNLKPKQEAGRRVL